MASFSWPSLATILPTYATLSAFPPAAANTGMVAIALDTGNVYESFAGSWQLLASPGGTTLSLGAFGSTPNADGASLTGDVLTLQPADGSHPGGVSTAAQSFLGNKSFLGQIAVNGAVNTLDLALVTGASPIAGNTVRGFHANYTAAAANTLTVEGYRSAITGAASTSLANLLNYASASPVLGSGGTITTFIDYSAPGASGHIATNNASFADNNAFTGNWFLNQSGTDASTLGGPLLIGTTAALTGATESLSVLSTTTTDVVTHTFVAENLVNNSSAMSTGQRGATTTAIRQASGNVTDTSTLNMASLVAYVQYNVPNGNTYTNAGSIGLSAIVIDPLNQVTSGSFYSGIYTGLTFNTENAAVTGRKQGIKFNGLSGGTIGNAFIADNGTYTGNWFIQSTNTSPSLLGGTLTVPALVSPTVSGGGSTSLLLQGGTTTGLTISSAGNTSASNTFTMAGDWHQGSTSDSSASPINALVSAGRTMVRLTAAGNITLNGITAPSPVAVQRLVVIMVTGSVLTINNGSGSAAAANVILTSTGSAVTRTYGAVEFIYNSADGYWQMLG